MADFADAKHRPHAIHTGEEPDNPITYGPESLRVTLDRWGPTDNLFTSMYDALQANWGDVPSRTVNRRLKSSSPLYACDDRVGPDYDVITGWAYLSENERAYIESCFAGKTLQQVLEGVTFDFCIDGVSRAFTHQNVRTRLGAGFMQHGGRDNDWRHRPWTMPETIRRMCVVDRNAEFTKASAVPWVAQTENLRDCITDWKPINEFLRGKLVEDVPGAGDSKLVVWTASLHEAIEDQIRSARHLYAALVDAGIPWQDARRVLPIGMQTYIHDQYNYLALQGVLGNRLEHIMDWEFNCVAQLMLREIKMKCPPLISKYLGSHSDRAKSAKFAGLESWPPDGKYPNPFERCAVCGHSEGNHVAQNLVDHGEIWGCEVCERSGGPGGLNVDPRHEYVAKDTLPRQHRSEQMPFFVLAPESMAGGLIRWIPTNGKYPHEVLRGEESR